MISGYPFLLLLYVILQTTIFFVFRISNVFPIFRVGGVIPSYQFCSDTNISSFPFLFVANFFRPNLIFLWLKYMERKIQSTTPSAAISLIFDWNYCKSNQSKIHNLNCLYELYQLYEFPTTSEFDLWPTLGNALEKVWKAGEENYINLWYQHSQLNSNASYFLIFVYENTNKRNEKYNHAHLYFGFLLSIF